MLYYIVSLYYHQFLFNFFCKENDTSSANNVVSLSHASFSVLATVSYFITNSTQIYLFINTFSSNHGTNTKPLEGRFLPLVSTLAFTLPRLDSTQHRPPCFSPFVFASLGCI